MESFLIYFIGIFIMCQFTEAQPSNQKKGMSHYQNGMMPIKCMGQELKLTKTMNDSIKLCHEKVFGANFDMEKPILKEIKKKAMCVFACQAQELGLMDYSGKLNEDNMQNITTKIFPKEAVEKLMTKVDKCTEEMGSEFKVTDKDCSSVEKLLHCLKNGFIEVCMPELKEKIEQYQNTSQ